MLKYEREEREGIAYSRVKVSKMLTDGEKTILTIPGQLRKLLLDSLVDNLALPHLPGCLLSFFVGIQDLIQAWLHPAALGVTSQIRTDFLWWVPPVSSSTGQPNKGSHIHLLPSRQHNRMRCFLTQTLQKVILLTRNGHSYYIRSQ